MQRRLEGHILLIAPLRRYRIWLRATAIEGIGEVAVGEEHIMGVIRTRFLNAKEI